MDGGVLAGGPGGVARYVDGVLGAARASGVGSAELAVLRPRRRGSTLAWTLWNLQRASGRGFDVLHCPFYYGPPAPRCAVTVAVHDVLPVSHPEWFPRSWASPIRWLMPGSARRADGVVTFARATADEIVERLGVPEARIRVIPHGVDRELFRPPGGTEAAAARERWTGGRPYVLQVGAVEPRRGIDLVVPAVAALRRLWPDLVLLLVGGDRAPVAELQDPPAWVIRAGRVADGELPALYAGAEAMLSPSRGEGFDLPLLEALASGAAVVASDIPVHVEHFAPAVELFASGDREALAAALERVVGDAELREDLRRRAVAHAAGFSWERSAREHLALWREIAGP